MLASKRLEAQAQAFDPTYHTGESNPSRFLPITLSQSGSKIFILRIKIRIIVNVIGVSSIEYNETKFHREVISLGGFLKS